MEIFQGRENIITMNQTHSKQFHCTYLLHYYPFDTQVRTIKQVNKIALTGAMVMIRFAECISSWNILIEKVFS